MFSKPWKTGKYRPARVKNEEAQVKPFKNKIPAIKQFIANLLVAASSLEYLRQLLDNLLLHTTKKRLLAIIPQSSCGQVLNAEMAPAIPSESVVPSISGHSHSIKPKLSIFPKIQAHRYSQVLIHSRSCGIVIDNKIAIPDYYFQHDDRYLLRSDIIRANNSRCALIKLTKPIITLQNGIFLAGLGSFNWYHWLVEILPIAMLATKLSDEYLTYPLLVPDEINKYPSFKDSLQVFAGERPIIPLSHQHFYKIDNLIVIDGPVHGPFNLHPGLWPEASDYQQHAGVLMEYRQRILQYLSIKSAQPERCIFLARGNTRREYDQQALASIATEFGLEIIYPETLSFTEQVQLFHSAKIIVGASGAAWAGLLFVRPATRCLSWLVPEYHGFCAFSNLAHLTGTNMHYVFTPSTTPLTSTHDAYTAKYEISPEQFRQALERLLA